MWKRFEEMEKVIRTSPLSPTRYVQADSQVKVSPRDPSHSAISAIQDPAQLAPSTSSAYRLTAPPLQTSRAQLPSRGASILSSTDKIPEASPVATHL